MGAALSTHRFGSVEAPGHTGMTHPEMQVFPSCRVSQRQRDESYALSPHRPPFPGVSRGFSLTLSLTHSPEGRARSHVLEEKKKKREKGREGRRTAKANPPALLLYLFLRESEARESKASALLGGFIFIY